MKTQRNPLEKLKNAIGFQMLDIEGMLEDRGISGVKLSFVARSPTNPNMFIILSNDDIAAVAELLANETAVSEEV
jgi:hypothetical protein